MVVIKIIASTGFLYFNLKALNCCECSVEMIFLANNLGSYYHHSHVWGGSRDSKGGMHNQRYVYVHNYSKYIMPIGSFLEGFGHGHTNKAKL